MKTDLSERDERGPHAPEQPVESLQFLQQHDRRRTDAAAELLPGLVDVEVGRQFADDVLRNVVDVVLAADARRRFPCTQGWRRGVVVSGVRRMNELNARRARLVLGWVTVFGPVYHLSM